MKRQAKNALIDKGIVAKAEATAKKNGKTVTMADIQAAAAPTVPSTKGRKANPNRVLDRAGALAVAVENHEVETLAMATALAFGSLPRVAVNKELNSPLPEGRGFHGSRRRFPASTGG